MNNVISFLSVGLLKGKLLFFHFFVRKGYSESTEIFSILVQVCCPDSNRQEVHNSLIQWMLDKLFLTCRPRSVNINNLRLGWRIEEKVLELGLGMTFSPAS